MLARCQAMAPRNKKFKLNEKVYLLDASLVELTLSLFPWAKYQKNKGAAKLHVGLDADGYLPAFVDLTEGKEHEINHARELGIAQRLLCGLRSWLYRLHLVSGPLLEDGVFFVTRLKSNAIVTPGRKRRGRKSPGVIEDREIRLGKLPETFRLVTYLDAETDITYQFVTNALDLPAQTVADLYKERWQIELFFKWIKTKPEGEELSGDFEKCRKDPALDRPVCLPGAVVPEVPVENRSFVAAHVADITAQFV